MKLQCVDGSNTHFRFLWGRLQENLPWCRIPRNDIGDNNWENLSAMEHAGKYANTTP